MHAPGYREMCWHVIANLLQEMAAHCVAIAQARHFLPGVCLLVVPQDVLSHSSIDSSYGIHLWLLPILVVTQGDLGHHHQPQSLIDISLTCAPHSFSMQQTEKLFDTDLLT